MDLMLLIKTIIMGLVEGATEFLPISSTGHLIIVGNILGFLSKEKSDVFEIIIQLGAIFAVCWAFKQRLLDTATNLTKESKAQHFVRNLLIAFVPAALLGLAFHRVIKEYLFSPFTVAIALIVGGFAILLIEKLPLKTPTQSVDDISSKQALQIGFAQALALVPGVSRAGATILGGMVFGLNRKVATEFSFFLAIPIMFAATGFDLLKSWRLLNADDLMVFAIGFVTAFLSALIAVKFLIRFVQTHNFVPFAWYRIVFGVVVLWYFW
jgi:undecaprenyl-diphosphatase